MKKTREDLALSNLEQRKPFRVIYDGEDYGIYQFNATKNRYEGEIGCLLVEDIYRCIKDKDYFIQVETI